ncbi:hypothetical protein MFLAVUS_008029 [Mucor flavus]|uniref:F-box domain-containing protein n=1 Tax=Mucor flavus TaxID=439312 RepID=A0ABP9Z610_9FUNG
MSSLPHEVLTLAFHHLETKDLLQCQLTCNKWREASLPLLYSNLCIDSNKKSLAYVRTISNSPILGKYLNSIDFGESLERDEELVFDRHSLLNTVINYCPNIAKIESYKYDILIWTRIMYAATQNQLSHLNALPKPDTFHLEPYIYTALLFKKSLTSLWLNDDVTCFGPQLVDLTAYQILCDQIDQFKNLQHLRFSYLSDRHLSYFDELIDKCHHLKTLSFDLTVETIIQGYKSELVIRPRPDIHTLSCDWRIINADNQLKYVMRKFPNLRSLDIEDEQVPMTNVDFTPNFSRHTVIKFVRYALSIPDFKIHIDVSEEDLFNIWTEFINAKNGCKDVNIGYYHREHSPNNWYNLMLWRTGGLKIDFPLDTDGDEPPHIRFFSKIGGSIRLLKVFNSDRIPGIDGKTSTTIDWLFDILHLCPLIEDITLYSPKSFSPSCHILKYPSVKRLVLKFLQFPESISFLNHLSLNLPELQQLDLSFCTSSDDDMHPIIINMPHTSIDLLIWNEERFGIMRSNITGIYVKLNTDTGLSYYEGNGNMLALVDTSRYLLSPRHIRLEINWLGLSFPFHTREDEQQHIEFLL